MQGLPLHLLTKDVRLPLHQPSSLVQFLAAGALVLAFLPDHRRILPTRMLVAMVNRVQEY